MAADIRKLFPNGIARAARPREERTMTIPFYCPICCETVESELLCDALVALPHDPTLRCPECENQ